MQSYILAKARQWSSAWAQDSKYLFFILVTCVVLAIFYLNFKLYALIVVILLMACFALTKKAFLSVFTLFFITLQLQAQVPGKYYTVEIIGPQEIDTELAPEGVVNEYGVQAVDLMAVLLALMLLRLGSLQKFEPELSLKLHAVDRLILTSWGVYFFISFFASLVYSFYPFFSLIGWLASLKLLVAYFSIRVLLPKYKRELFLLFVGALCFQAVVVSFQVTKGVFSSIENSKLRNSFVVAEEETLFPRPFGTFVYWNELSLIVSLVLGMAVLVQSDIKLANQRLLVIVAAAATGTSVLFAQTRVIWGVLLLAAICWCALKYKEVKTLFSFVRTGKLQFYVSVVTLAVLGVVLPRILLSQYIFEESGGISLRKEMFTEGFEILQEMPWTGYGVDTNLRVTYEAFPDGYVSYFPLPIHSSYLITAIEAGLLGAFLLWFPLVYLLRMSMNAFQKNQQFLYFVPVVILLMVLIFYAIHNLIARVELPFLGLLLSVIVYYYTDRWKFKN